MKTAKEIKLDLKQIEEETGFDIGTPEGARAYLESEGIDVDKCTEEGMKEIERLKIKHGLTPLNN